MKEPDAKDIVQFQSIAISLTDGEKHEFIIIRALLVSLYFIEKKICAQVCAGLCGFVRVCAFCAFCAGVCAKGLCEGFVQRGLCIEVCAQRLVRPPMGVPNIYL